MFRDILVPLDLGDPKIWEKALETAVTLARTYGARLRLMTVLPDYGMPVVGQFFPPDHSEKLRAKAREELRAIARRAVPEGIAVDVTVSQGSIWREIVREAKEREVDLIVMGSHRPGVGDYVLGANATRVAQRASASVMIVRS